MNGTRLGMEGARARRSLRAALALSAVFAAGAVSSRARAAVIYQLTPTTSVGATSNAQALASGSASTFSGLYLTAQARLDQPRHRHSLSTGLTYTHYFATGTRDTVGTSLTATSAFDITGALGLSLGAGATVSRTSSVATATAPGQAALPGSRLYVASSATEGLGYQATQRLRLGQSFGVNRVDYLTDSLQSSPGGRPSTGLSAGLNSSYSWTNDGVSLDVTGTDLIAGPGTDPLGNPIQGGHTLLGQATAGWHHDYSLVWSSELRGGMAWMMPPSGKVTPLPAGMASLDYRRFPWFGGVSVSHAPVANLFLGVATVNDSLLFRLSVPLDRGEMVVLAGTASYSRGRAADQSDPIAGVYNYNQLAAGGVLSVRFRERPLFGSVSYTLMDQQGTSPMSGQSLNVVRHTVLLNLTASFMFGPGTPPLTGGGVMQPQ
jgi:hypothetical protein